MIELELDRPRLPSVKISKQPRFEIVKERSTKAKHCFSACLYHEPDFKKLFPKRNYNKRYLEIVERLIPYFKEKNYALNVFCDAKMLPVAEKFGFGSIYLVNQHPTFPFSQHLYRYYSVFLPEHETIRAYHFRGMDNLIPTEDFTGFINHFLFSKSDLLHAPYTRIKGGLVYTPVRGSCSVANNGISSLASFIRTNKPEIPVESWRAWHCDETYLTKWFNQCKLNLKLMTIIDRDMHMQFYCDFHKILSDGKSMTIKTLRDKEMLSSSVKE